MDKNKSMCFKTKIINLAQIDIDDNFFRITTELKVDDLMMSIKHLGLLNFPLLLEKESGYAIISGFRRIEACRRLNWFELSARVLGSDADRFHCVNYAITDNAFQRPLDIIEKSKCFKMLSEFYKDIDSLAEALPALGLSEHPSMIKKIQTVYDMPKSLQNSLHSNAITLAMALELAELAMDDAEGLISLFNTLKLSLNKQREILTTVKEIAVREDIPVIQVLSSLQLKSILINKDLDSNLKSRKIRAYLKRRRYPAITSAEKIFQNHLQKLNPEKGLEFIPPVNFEGSTYTLKLTFKNLKELKKLQSNLDGFIENPYLKKIVSG